MPADIKFYDRQVLRKVKAKLGGRYRRAGVWLRNRIREAVGISNQKGKFPSLPGNYPHAGTRTFQRSIVDDYDPANSRLRVGSTDPKAVWLQRGTSRMRPRPWYTLAVEEFRAGVNRIIKGG